MIDSTVYSLPGPGQFINTVSGSQMRISSGLRSCTSIVQITPPFMLDGRSIRLIDTPGFDDTTKSDTEILRMIALFLTEASVSSSLLSVAYHLVDTT